MNDLFKPEDSAALQFGIGQPVSRLEDPALLRGEGRYTDDVSLPGQAYAAFVRSPHAHGTIEAISTEAARAMPGVLAVYTAADLTPMGYGPLKCVIAFQHRDGSPMTTPLRHSAGRGQGALRRRPGRRGDRGDRRSGARRGRGRGTRHRPLPAVTCWVPEAIAPGGAALYDEAPDNLALHYHYGDTEKVAEAFAKAAHVTRLEILNNRIVVNPMEPRAAVVAHDAATGRFTVHAPSQGVFGKRNNLAEAMGVPPDRIHLITGNVGGSFGMKGAVFPEYVCLMHAAARTRPAGQKWTDQRSDSSFMSDHHGRDMEARWWPSWRSMPRGTSSPPASPATATSAPTCRRWAR